MFFPNKNGGLYFYTQPFLLIVPILLAKLQGFADTVYFQTNPDDAYGCFWKSGYIGSLLKNDQPLGWFGLPHFREPRYDAMSLECTEWVKTPCFFMFG